MLWPEDQIAKFPPLDQWPEDQLEKSRMLKRIGDEVFGYKDLRDPNLVTCGHCSIVCGPTLKETGERYRALLEGGIVVPGPEGGTWIRCADYAEAVEMRRKYPIKVSRLEMLKDQARLAHPVDPLLLRLRAQVLLPGPGLQAEAEKGGGRIPHPARDARLGRGFAAGLARPFPMTSRKARSMSNPGGARARAW